MITIVTEPNDVTKVASALEKLGYTYDSAEAEYIPTLPEVAAAFIEIVAQVAGSAVTVVAQSLNDDCYTPGRSCAGRRQKRFESQHTMERKVEKNVRTFQMVGGFCPPFDLERGDPRLRQLVNMLDHTEVFRIEQVAAPLILKDREILPRYLTCNTLPTNEEAEQLPEFLRMAQEAGVDALIVADVGILPGRFSSTRR